MKKRKELNALIGLGDSKRKKTKQGSGHRLLRTEPPGSQSESSSEDDEFNNMGTVAAFGKRSYTQCCNVCYPLFLFIILAACVMACAGLIWMQIALKEDLDSLKEKLHIMESSQKVSSHELPKLSEDLKNKQRKLEDIESGDRGLSKLWSNLTEINKKINLLDTAVNHLKANIKSASDLINLPTTVEELQKSVATIGSTLTSVQHDVQTMQTALDNQRKDTESLQKTMDVKMLSNAVSEANKTHVLQHLETEEQIHNVLLTMSNLSQRVSSLELKSTQISQQNGSQVGIKQGPASGNPAAEAIQEAATAEVSHDTATTDTALEKSTVLTISKPTRRPRFLSTNRSKRSALGTGRPETVSLPGIISLKDLEELFQQVGLAQSSLGMTHQELRRLLGPLVPDATALERHDKDKNGRYSLLELKAAAGV